MSEVNEKCWYKEVCGMPKDKCGDRCIRYMEMLWLMENSGLPKAKQRPIDLYAPKEDYEAYQQLAEIKSNIDEFVEDGKNLMIASKYTGNGKTSWAIKMLLKYFDLIWDGNGFKQRGYFVHVPSMLLQMKDFNSNEGSKIKKAVLNCDLVVFDDVASTYMTAYDYSQLLAMIDSRLFSEKSCIFTSNVDSFEELNKILGAKLVSRIWNGSTVIKLVGQDCRKEYE